MIAAMTPGQVLDPNIAARRKLAQEMMLAGRDVSPVIHPYQGLARVISGLAGGYFDRLADEEEKSRRVGMQNTMEQAMRASAGGWTNPDTPGGPVDARPLPDGAGAPIAPGATVKQGPGGYDALVNVLTQNPDTAPMALQLGLNQVVMKQQLANELLKARNQFQLKREFEPLIAGETEEAKNKPLAARRQAELEQDKVMKPQIEGAVAAAVTPEMNKRAGYAANASAQAGLSVAEAKAAAEARGKAAGEAGTKLPEKATNLRKEFDLLQPVKNYREVVPAFQRMTTAADTAAGDLNIVFGLMKMLDPASVVRESEQKVAYAAGSPAERLQGVWNYLVMQNGRLGPDQRQSMIAEARNALKSHGDSFDQIASTYSRLATESGVNPADVVLRTTPNEPPPKPTAKPNLTINPPKPKNTDGWQIRPLD